MKRHGQLFDRVCDVTNIQKAIYESSKTKRNRKSVQRSLNQSLDTALKIRDMLQSLNFTLTTHTKYKHENGKERSIEVAPYYPNQIMHHAFMRVVEPIIRKSIHHNSFSHIKGKGLDKGLIKSKKYCRKYKYFLKFDLKKFYDNVDIETMVRLFERKFKDPKLTALLRIFLTNSPHKPTEEDIANGHRVKGINIGSYLSGILANFYLYQLDHRLAAFNNNYYNMKFIRYADDIVIWGNDKKELWSIYKKVVVPTAKELNLTVHKANLAYVNQQGVDFLGVRMLKTHSVLRRRNAEKIKRLADCKRVTDHIFARIFSFYGFTKRCNCFNLWSHVLKRVSKGTQSTLRTKIWWYCKRMGIRNPLKGLCFYRRKPVMPNPNKVKSESTM